MSLVKVGDPREGQLSADVPLYPPLQWHGREECQLRGTARGLALAAEEEENSLEHMRHTGPCPALGVFLFFRFFLQMYSSFHHCPINSSSLGGAVSLILLRAGGGWGWGAQQMWTVEGRKALQRKLDELD